MVSTILALSACSVYADSMPSVLMITPTADANGQVESSKIVEFTINTHKEITKLSGNVLYGSDENVLAILQTLGKDPSFGSRLLVIDRKSSNILVDTNLSEIRTTPFIANILEKIAVNSKEFDIYFPAVDHSSGLASKVRTVKPGHLVSCY